MRNFDEIIRTYGTNADYEVIVVKNSRQEAIKVTRISDGQVIVDISIECPTDKFVIKIKPGTVKWIGLVAVVILICIIVMIF